MGTPLPPNVYTQHEDRHDLGLVSNQQNMAKGTKWYPVPEHCLSRKWSEPGHRRMEAVPRSIEDDGGKVGSKGDLKYHHRQEVLKG